MPKTKPTLNYEKLFWQCGCEYVAGVDEAGVAPLAGPVVAAAVVLKPDTTLHKFRKINDSKILSKDLREDLYETVLERCVDYGVGVGEVEEIDRINIHKATRLAMRRAVEDLKQAKTLLVDGPWTIPKVKRLQFAVVDGDAKIASISAASIVAKVTRDRMMIELHKKYKQYGFESHKGYPTKQHIKMILKHGPIEAIHRKTFLANILQRELF